MGEDGFVHDIQGFILGTQAEIKAGQADGSFQQSRILLNRLFVQRDGHGVHLILLGDVPENQKIPGIRKRSLSCRSRFCRRTKLSSASRGCWFRR